ncbi:hypothetical protein DBA29_25965 [Xenophilus aerolatus]|nr:hypothetical protein [Xenophilus aerolatus]
MALATLAMACSPVFNWREVPVGESLVAMLPCKPDRAERSLPIGPATVPIDMAGCEAGGATFAVARLPGGDASQAEARLAAWRQAAKSPWAGAQLAEAPWTLPRAATAPAPWALDVTNAAADGRPAEAHLRWFAGPDGQGGIMLYQAMVLGRPSAADAAETFFDGLRLR